MKGLALWRCSATRLLGVQRRQWPVVSSQLLLGQIPTKGRRAVGRNWGISLASQVLCLSCFDRHLQCMSREHFCFLLLTPSPHYHLTVTASLPQRFFCFCCAWAKLGGWSNCIYFSWRKDLYYIHAICKLALSNQRVPWYLHLFPTDPPKTSTSTSTSTSSILTGVTILFLEQFNTQYSRRIIV
jgi:hypothetical protein